MTPFRTPDLAQAHKHIDALTERLTGAEKTIGAMVAQLHAVKNVRQLPFLKGAMAAALHAANAYYAGNQGSRER